MASKKDKPKLIVDSREKVPHRYPKELWSFIGDVVVSPLKDGDYTLDVFKDKKWLWLERKHSCAELYSNIIGKDRARFFKCLERAKLYRYRYVVVEDTLGSLWSLRKRVPRMRARPDALLARILELSMDYGIHFVFAGSSAERVCRSLLKRAYEKWRRYLKNDSYS